MHWIEELTGLDPDNGSGTMEIALIVLAVLVALALVQYARSRG